MDIYIYAIAVKVHKIALAQHILRDMHAYKTIQHTYVNLEHCTKPQRYILFTRIIKCVVHKCAISVVVGGGGGGAAVGVCLYANVLISA